MIPQVDHLFLDRISEGECDKAGKLLAAQKYHLDISNIQYLWKVEITAIKLNMRRF